MEQLLFGAGVARRSCHHSVTRHRLCHFDVGRGAAPFGVVLLILMLACGHNWLAILVFIESRVFFLHAAVFVGSW